MHLQTSRHERSKCPQADIKRRQKRGGRGGGGGGGGKGVGVGGGWGGVGGWGGWASHVHALFCDDLFQEMASRNGAIVRWQHMRGGGAPPETEQAIPAPGGGDPTRQELQAQ